MGFAVEDADAKKGCWSEIAKCLEGRTLKSIYAFGTRIIDPGNQMGAWTQDETAKLVASDAATDNWFGRSVSISGDVIASTNRISTGSDRP